MHYCQKESENERHNRQRPHFEVDWLNEPMCPAKNWLLSEWLAAFSVGPACWVSIQMVISPISYILVHYYIQHIYILCIVICFGPTALFTCWVGSNHTNDKTTFLGGRASCPLEAGSSFMLETPLPKLMGLRWVLVPPDPAKCQNLCQ